LEFFMSDLFAVSRDTRGLASPKEVIISHNAMIHELCFDLFFV